MTILALLATLLLSQTQDAPGHWPQWHGQNRDSRSTEKGLLQEWPEGGPRLLWSTNALGDGFPPVSVAGGRIYGIGYLADGEYVSSLDGAGNLVWSVPIGPKSGEFPSMRYISQRAVAVDDDRLYAFTAEGVLHCLKTTDGTTIWKRPYKELGGLSSGFSYSDSPLVDGPVVICKPGGNKGHLAALNKNNGATVWQSSEVKEPATHAPLAVTEIDGIRQYVALTMNRVVGIEAKTGRLLWSAPKESKTVAICTPMVQDGIVFVGIGYGVGCEAFRITSQDRTFHAASLYAGKQLEIHRGSAVVVGNHVYGASTSGYLRCVELQTGTVAWEQRMGNGSLSYADGRLLTLLDQSGEVALVDAVPDQFRERGRIKRADRPKEAMYHPVVAGGRLYLREPTALTCYDLRGPDYKDPPVVWLPPGAPRPRKPGEPPKAKVDAAFVPTPRDVVQRMLELAKVGKDDVVYDLGSGDGRIVMAAARNHGCKAVGYEIDPDLVRESRQEIAKAKLESLVTIEEKDLFKADLSGASVVTLYLGAGNNARLLPQLRTLKPKSRIVSHQHRLGEAGPEPDERLIIVSKDDPDPHVIYLWITPLKE